MDLLKIQFVNEAVISPDGSKIAFTKIVPEGVEIDRGRNNSELHVWDIDKNSGTSLITGDVYIQNIAWDFEGKFISFLSSLDESGTQVHRISPAANSSAEALTQVSGSILDYAWNPNKNELAYTVQSAPYRHPLYDRGFDAEVYEENLPTIDLYIQEVGKEAKKVTENLIVRDFEWKPDGKMLAIQTTENYLVDEDYMFREIHLLDPRNGKTELLVDKHGKLGPMTWSPDGKLLAFISGENINDPVRGCLFATEVAKKQPFAQLTNLVAGFQGHVTHVEWLDEQTLAYSSDEGTRTTIRSQSIAQKVEESKILLEAGLLAFSSFSQHKSETFAISGNTSAYPSELHIFNSSDKKLTRLTFSNRWLESVQLAKQETIKFAARDGLSIEGVLIYPVNYEEGKQYPLITNIHGGPEACVLDGWTTGYGTWGQIAAGRDFFVFSPNYRSSSGRGVEFSRLGYGRLALEEFDDVLDGIDYLIGKGMVDPQKVGIGGGSYGGYFAAWAATKHSERFAASCVFVGVSNQISKRNTTDIPWEDYYVHWGLWTDDALEQVYESSPVRHVRNNQTPTLILHGKMDPRVHPSQSLELYRGLKMHGNAPVRLVWYPREGHGNAEQPHRIDYATRTMQWFEYYLKDGGPRDQMPPANLEFPGWN